MSIGRIAIRFTFLALLLGFGFNSYSQVRCVDLFAPKSATANWTDDRAYIEAGQENEQFGKVGTFYSEKWGTQVYSTQTGTPGLDGQVPLVDPDAKAVYIFIHGSGTMKSGGRNYIANMNNLANMGYSAISFDLPFHSNGPTDPKFNNAQYFMQWLRQIVLEVKKSGKPIYLAGHSFGPDVVFEFLTQFPRLVNGGVGISPAAFTKDLEDWYYNFTDKMVFGGDVPSNDAGGTWAADVSKQFEWHQPNRLRADPTVLNPNLRVRILSGNREEYVPAPLGANGLPDGENTYDVSIPLSQMLKNATITIEPGIGHYLFEHQDSNGFNVVTRELLLVDGQNPAQIKQLIAQRRQTDDLNMSYVTAARKYILDRQFRAYCDLKFGVGNTIRRILFRRDNEFSASLLKTYGFDLDKRQREIYQKILSSKELYPAFYAKYQAIIDKSNPKNVDTRLFVQFAQFLENP